MTSGDGERKRLLLFTNSVQVGGVEEHVRLIAKELNGNAFDVSVVMPDWDETNWFAKRVEQVADDLTLITPDRRPGGRGPLRETIRLALHTRRLQVDVAHLHSTTFEGQMLAILAIRAAGVRRVFLTEHLAPDRRVAIIDQIRRRFVERLATGLVSVSARNQESRMRYLGGPVDKMHVVDNGIDVARLDEPIPDDTMEGIRLQHQIPADAEIIGTAIRLEPGKGVADLIDGFDIIRKCRPNAHLLIVGDGSLRLELEQQCERLGIVDRVTMTGFASDPRPYIAMTDVFVLPVPFGSASIVLLEAMAMSKACVITFGGEGEAVVPGESGFWAEPRDPASIADYVMKLLEDTDLRHKIEKNARLRVERSFSARRVAEELAELYQGR